MDDQQALGQAEIWDDSALQMIWNTSVKEYQRYHSINARGEDVAEVLRRAAAAESEDDADDLDVDVKAALVAELLAKLEEGGEVPEDGELINEDSLNVDSTTRPQPEENPPPKSVNGTTKMELEQPNALPPIPQAMIAQSTNDEKLKNLMMSWYWAGYYTGLYEGQQQGHTNGATNST